MAVVVCVCIQVGNEFGAVEALWSQFEGAMAKDKDGEGEEGRDGGNEDEEEEEEEEGGEGEEGDEAGEEQGGGGDGM